MKNKAIVIVTMACVMSTCHAYSQNISAGAQFSFVRMSDNTIRSFGLNGVAGKLGIGTYNTLDWCTNKPMTVVYLSGGASVTNVTAVSGGREHGLALLQDGTLVGWGEGDSGEMGNSFSADKIAAVHAGTNLNSVAQIGTGWGFNVALLSNGNVYAWGKNNAGQVGSGIPYGSTQSGTNEPVQVPGLSSITNIVVGAQHSFALSNGILYAWGNRGDSDANRLGDNPSGTYVSYTPTPVQVANLSNVVTMAGGAYHSLAVTSDGRVWSWGAGGGGQLGTGGTTNSAVPVLVPGLGTVTMTVTTNDCSGVITGGAGTCVTNGYRTCTEVATNYCTNNFVTAVAAGPNFSLALTKDGSVFAWGTHAYGQIGVGGESVSVYKTPVQVRNSSDTGYLSNVVAISASKHDVDSVHAMALTSDGKVFTWGRNDVAQLGVPTSTEESTLPIEVNFNQ